MPDEDITEEWRQVLGYEGSYEVSSLGRVRSVDRILGQIGSHGKPIVRQLRGRVLKTHAQPGRYKKCILSRKSHDVHIVVLTAFSGPKAAKHLQCRHLDGDNLNNRADNLKWGTILENRADTRRHGRLRSGHTKLYWPQVDEIRRRAAAGETAGSIAIDFPVKRDQVQCIMNGTSWRRYDQ